MSARSNPLVPLLTALIRLYQWLISPLLRPSCRHLPTCSDYARDALLTHGFVRGGWLSLRRLLRCHPWGSDGYDPVPPANTKRRKLGARDRAERV